MYGFIYGENRVLERLLDDEGFFPNLNINVEKIVFHSF